jgi:hypothetical protein
MNTIPDGQDTKDAPRLQRQQMTDMERVCTMLKEDSSMTCTVIAAEVRYLQCVSHSHETARDLHKVNYIHAEQTSVCHTCCQPLHIFNGK